jgi:hypothetical protein
LLSPRKSWKSPRSETGWADRAWIFRPSTVTSPEGDLLLTEESGSWLPTRDVRPLSSHPDRQLRVSPSGRFLPFLRTKSIVLEADGRKEYSGYPERVELVMLDLQNGHELTLLRAPAERKVRERFESTLKDWLWRQWDVAHGNTESILWETNGKAKYFPDPYYPKLLPLAWAPGCDRFAVLYSDTIFFFEYLPDAAAKAEQDGVTAFQGMGGFLPTGSIELPEYGITDFAFCDKETMLAWRAWVVQDQLQGGHGRTIRQKGDEKVPSLKRF